MRVLTLSDFHRRVNAAVVTLGATRPCQTDTGEIAPDATPHGRGGGAERSCGPERLQAPHPVTNVCERGGGGERPGEAKTAQLQPQLTFDLRESNTDVRQVPGTTREMLAMLSGVGGRT